MVHLSDCQLSFTICQLKQIDMQKVISSRIGYWVLDMCKVALRRNSFADNHWKTTHRQGKLKLAATELRW